MGGGGKGGSAPAAPDYQALLGQQGQINYGTFENQLYAGRTNASNPYGSTAWTPPPLVAPNGSTTAAPGAGGAPATSRIAQAAGMSKIGRAHV